VALDLFRCHRRSSPYFHDIRCLLLGTVTHSSLSKQVDVVFDNLDGHKIYSRGTVRPNRKDMPWDFEPKKLKLKRSDVRVKTRGGLTALVWKDRREVYMLTNMDPPPAEGNFCDDSNCPVKPHIVERYNWHMGFIDISDHMANSNSMSRSNFKWNMNLFFRLLGLTVLNSWILLSSCGA